jgi:hypothetical protein
MIVSGGGGAGTWAGNDVRGLRLEDDQPTWRVLVSPTNAQYAPKNDNLTTNTPYNLSVSALVATPADYTFALTDGAPVARHSYWHQFVDDVTDDFYWTRCDSVWQTDAGRFEEVNSIHLPDTVGATVAWPAAVPAARKHPVPHGHAEGAGGAPSNYCLTTKFPEVGDARDGFIYQIASGMWCFKPRAASGVGTWTSVTLTNAGILNGDKGPGAIDPTRNCFLFSTAPGTFHTSEPVYRVAVLNAAGTSATLFVATLTTAGGNLSAFAVKDVLGFADPLGSSGEVQDVAELEYDRGLDKFILFQDDQKLYTLTCTSTSTWTFRVDKLVDALTPSTVIGSGVPKLYGSKQGQVMAMWGRMRYVHALGGVCVIQGADQNAFFVRTRLINGV